MHKDLFRYHKKICMRRRASLVGFWSVRTGVSFTIKLSLKNIHFLDICIQDGGTILQIGEMEGLAHWGWGLKPGENLLVEKDYGDTEMVPDI